MLIKGAIRTSATSSAVGFSNELIEALGDPRAINIRKRQSDGALFVVPSAHSSPKPRETLAELAPNCTIFDVEIKQILPKSGPVGPVGLIIPSTESDVFEEYAELTTKISEMEKRRGVLKTKIHRAFDEEFGSGKPGIHQFAPGAFMERTIQFNRVVNPQTVVRKWGNQALVSMASVRVRDFDKLAKEKGLDLSEQEPFILERKPTTYLRVKQYGEENNREEENDSTE